MRIFKILIFFGIIISFVCCAQDIQLDYAYTNKTRTVELGARDILFVVDNSCTMIAEQEKLASHFTGFINFLENFNLDWRIGITTTEISGPNSGLLRFENGKHFLDSKTANYASLFQKGIERPETKDEANCNPDGSINRTSRDSSLPPPPSMDERGIYSVNGILNRGSNLFFRDNTRLAIIFISDEDVRSGLYYNHNDDRVSPTRPYNSPRLYNTARLPLEENDKPETLVLNIRNQLGAKTTVSFHSIIILPGEEEERWTKDPCSHLGNRRIGKCLCQQLGENEAPNHKQLIGKKYYELSRPNESLSGLGSIIPGTVESICKNSYDEFYETLALHLEEREVPLDCKGVLIKEVEVQTYDDGMPLRESIDYTIDRDRGVVIFKSHIRSDRKINVDMTCY